MVKKPIDMPALIQLFKDLAAKIGADFSYNDNRKQHPPIWGAHHSRKTGLTFNGMKQAAGLPVRLRRKNGNKSAIGYDYEPKSIKKLPKGKKYRCLGILPSDEQCASIVRAPRRLCDTCKSRNNNL